MLKNEKVTTPECCCDDMQDAISDNEHPLYYSSAYQEFGLQLSSKFEYSVLKHCMWCGSKLPNSRRDQWFDELEKQGIDPWEQDIPIHYLSSAQLGGRMPNKAKQHQSLRSLDSLALAPFVHGFAIVAQKSQSQVCRCWRRYML